MSLSRLSTSATLAAVGGLMLVALPLASAAASTQAAIAASAVTAPAKKGPALTVSKTTNLRPAGQIVTVKGSGFDTSKGIYVSFCVTPPPGQLPTPCGGGMTTQGAGDLSHWISSNPPSYGVGLAEPYGPKGTFTVKLRVSPTIGTGDTAVDCTKPKACAVVARADHTLSSDRSQDVVIPVTFKK